EIPDMTMAELQQWEDSDRADWIYIDGIVHLQDRFFESVKKVYPEIAKRAGIEPEDKSLLIHNIAHMKEHGTASWHIHMKASLKLKDSSFIPGKKILVHLPVPAVCANMKNIHIIETSPEHASAADENSLARTVSFTETLTENHPFTVEYEYDSCVRYTNPNPEEARPLSSAMDCSEIAPAVVFTPFIRTLLKELKKDETNPLIIARRIYDYCTTQVTYAFMREYMTNECIPDYCGASLKGDCGVQALLFITLCRCAGIPAHWQSGLYVSLEYTGSHDWAMFYAEPWGWMFADPSFGGSAYRAGDSERWNYYFGNLDPFRMAANNEVLMELDPPKSQYRNDPYDNQRGEAEYEDAKLLHEDYETEQTLIEMTQID
ncbi:MAG: transglutaminase domain-containing protein, partial [Erysipelotrichia bacterium]|nr:transglutaminase domain-containing protein [Erysipelotrichia bacterium]